MRPPDHESTRGARRWRRFARAYIAQLTQAGADDATRTDLRMLTSQLELEYKRGYIDGLDAARNAEPGK